MIEPTKGSTWWLDDGADSGVWPVIVHGQSIFGVRVEGTNPGGPYYGETITVDRHRVYDNAFTHPGSTRACRMCNR